jgi:hypothetical protein
MSGVGKVLAGSDLADSGQADRAGCAAGMALWSPAMNSTWARRPPRNSDRETGTGER